MPQGPIFCWINCRENFTPNIFIVSSIIRSKDKKPSLTYSWPFRKGAKIFLIRWPISNRGKTAFSLSLWTDFWSSSWCLKLLLPQSPTIAWSFPPASRADCSIRRVFATNVSADMPPVIWWPRSLLTYRDITSTNLQKADWTWLSAVCSFQTFAWLPRSSWVRTTFPSTSYNTSRKY